MLIIIIIIIIILTFIALKATCMCLNASGAIRMRSVSSMLKTILSSSFSVWAWTDSLFSSLLFSPLSYILTLTRSVSYVGSSLCLSLYFITHSTFNRSVCALIISLFFHFFTSLHLTLIRSVSEVEILNSLYFPLEDCLSLWPIFINRPDHAFWQRNCSFDLPVLASIDFVFLFFIHAYLLESGSASTYIQIFCSFLGGG